jgi:broad specificity phosphatase PhoE
VDRISICQRWGLIDIDCTNMNDLWLIRHGETTWSLAGRHTGRTDLPLTKNGEAQAARLQTRLAGHRFGQVFTSPLARARQTARLAGLDAGAVVDADLHEWDYGDYEGQTRAEIRTKIPDWTLWDAGAAGGEGAADVALRVDRVLARAAAVEGDVAFVAHGHVLRVVAARWLGLAPTAGRIFALAPASVSVLRVDSEQRVIELWNDASHLAGM